MPLNAIVFCSEDTLESFKSYYGNGVREKIFKVISYVTFQNTKVSLPADLVIDTSSIDTAILHSYRLYFHSRFKSIEALGFPSSRIIDGRAFQIPGLDFSRLLKEGVAYGILDKKSFNANSRVIYPQAYKFKNNSTTLALGKKSYIVKNASLEGEGSISVKNFSSLAKNILFSLGENGTHNYRNVSSTSLLNTDWAFPKNFHPPQGVCKIEIGNDVWIGRGNILKCTNPKEPLIIGDGAVIASDSVVVKDVPPYAIVGGNPAQIIKYRFPPDVVEALLRIKWWDWSLDKIHDNFKCFNDIEKFISLHDKE